MIRYPGSIVNGGSNLSTFLMTGVSPELSVATGIGQLNVVRFSPGCNATSIPVGHDVKSGAWMSVEKDVSNQD